MPPPDGSPLHAGFPTTCWTRLCERDARPEALETLAARYWPAVVAWLARGVARDEHEARDLAQGFFVHVAESGLLDKADRRRGRFRAFLKTALRNWTASEARKLRSEARGGALRFVPLDDPRVDEVPEELAPDDALDAAWRAALVRGALERTRARLEARGHAVRYLVFHAYHVGGEAALDYAALAARHGISRVDVSNHLARAKAAFREELRALVLETVGNDEDLRAELAWLIEGAG